MPSLDQQPIVRVPFIVHADVYLDNNAEHFPYDVTFTDKDDVTRLYHMDMPETLKTGTNEMIIFGVKINDMIPKDSDSEVHIWYGCPAQTQRHGYWSGVDTFAFYEDFENGLTNFISEAGTWSTVDQQQPILKGGPKGWSRSPSIVKKDGLYYLFHGNAQSWAPYNQGLYIWRTPWNDLDISTTPNLHDYFKLYPNISLGHPEWTHWLPISNFNIMPPGLQVCNILLKDGVYYMLYLAMGVTETLGMSYGIATSTDLLTWTTSENNPVWVQGQDEDPTTMAWGSLFYDESTSKWYIYLAYLGNAGDPGVHYLTSDYVDHNYTYQGKCFGSAYYTETATVLKEGSTYYMFLSDREGFYGDDRDTQMIRYATASSPAGTFTEVGRITLDLYDWNYSMTGMPNFWKEGSDWYMVYFGQPHTSGGVNDTEENDFIGYAKATSFPSTWEAQNLRKMARCSTVGSHDLLVKID
jgi:hypothetical protein